MTVKLHTDTAPIIANYLQGISEPKITDPQIIKLCSNESALGPSPKALEAYYDAAQMMHRYHDGTANTLRSAIAKFHSVIADYIICGAGIDGLIDLLVSCAVGPGDEVLYSQYGYLMYPIAALRVGATPVAAPETNMRTDITAILNYVTERTKVVFIANPNNPTGSYITGDEMKHLRQKLPANVLLVIDSAYADYVTASDYTSGVELVESSDENTIVLQTFSKIYGLAGIRLGWAYCPPSIADALNTMQNSFNISSVAIATGTAAVKDTEHVTASKEHNSKWLPWLSDQLNAIGIKTYPSSTNFVLAEFPLDPRKNAEQADSYLKSNYIIGRTLDKYGLGYCMSFSVGKEKEIKRLVEVLKDFMSFS